ncbi:MAG: B12-binding domain-containing radical SAM protein [Candidatus Helarchaeota archaeon]
MNLADLITEQGENNQYFVKQVAMPPMGLLYLGQILHANGYSVKIYDQLVTGASNNEIMKLIKRLDPTIVGFSVLFNNLWTTIDLLKRLKSWNPNIITVAGNYFPTFFPEKLMRELNFDFGVRGEGEYILLNLVNKIFKRQENFEEIKGLVYRKNGVIKSTDNPPKIKDLDAIPIPDRKLIDFNYRLQRKSTSLLSSRGCPFKCRFCFFSAVMGKGWRPRSVGNIIEEMLLLQEQGYKDILFADDNFSLSKKRVFQLTAEIKRNKLDNLNFSGVCRIDNTSLDLMRALVTMNCRKIMYGIESGNQRILDYYQKGLTVDQIWQAIRTAKKAKIEIIFGSFILGAPNETLDEVKNTIIFANKLKLSYIVFQILETIQISPIFQELVEKGLYKPKPDDWKRTFKVPDICSTAVPTKLLFRLMDEGIIQFFNKGYFTRLLLDTLRKDYYVETIFNFLTNFNRGLS